MRTHSRCPKCNGTKLYVCTNHQPDDDGLNYVHAMTITAVTIPQSQTGSSYGTSFRTHAGTYETWICAACGYTEWYAQDREHMLQKLATIPESGVRIVDGDPKAPYR